MIIDALLILVIIVGFYIGRAASLFKLLLWLLFGVICIVGANEIAPSIYSLFGSFMDGTIKHPYIFSVVIGLFIVVGILLLIRRQINKVFSISKLIKVTDSLSGIMMSFMFVVFYSGLVWFVDASGFISNNIKTKSFSFETLCTIPTRMKDVRKTMASGYDKIKTKTKDSYERLKKSHEEQK